MTGGQRDAENHGEGDKPLFSRSCSRFEHRKGLEIHIDTIKIVLLYLCSRGGIGTISSRLVCETKAWHGKVNASAVVRTLGG